MPGKLNSEFRQNLGAMTEFGQPYKLGEHVGVAVEKFLFSKMEGGGDKSPNWAKSETGSIAIFRGNMASHVSSSITRLINLVEFNQAGKSLGDKGEQAQLELILKAVLERILNVQTKLAENGLDSTQTAFLEKELKLLKSLLT